MEMGKGSGYFGHRFAVLFFMLFGGLFAASPTAHGQSAHPWPMFMHDASHTGQGQVIGPKTAPQANWKYELPDGAVNQSPVISGDGTIYLANSGMLFAINPDGSSRWIYSPNGGGLVDGAPALAADGTIYIPSNSDSFYAVNANGSLKWAYRTGGAGFNYSSPTVGQDGTIYVGCGLDLLALSPAGTLLWKNRVGDDINSSPAIGLDGTIYVRSHDYLCAVRKDGTQKWKLDLGRAPGAVWNSSPVIGPSGSIYTYGEQDYVAALYSVSPAGSVEWSLPDAWGYDSTPGVGPDGTIYVVRNYGDGISAVSPTGALKWTYIVGYSDNRVSPAIDAEGTVFVGGEDSLYALASDGSLQWKVNFEGSKFCTAVLGANGTLYTATYDGYLYSLGAGTPGSNWNTAYALLFEDHAELDLMRQYRDQILAKSMAGQLFTTVLYHNSDNALQALLDNSDLMTQAKNLIAANKGAVASVLSGKQGVIRAADVIAFLDAYGEKASPALKTLSDMIKDELLARKKKGEPFLGFRFK